ncbi:voltage-dependent calcium channel beta subunit-associated regulatory protein [Lampetra planeri]
MDANADNVTAPSAVAPTVPNGYALLLVLLSVFVGGGLVIVSSLFIICRQCCRGGRRYTRADDDAEKTTTTYVDETQHPREIAIKITGVDDDDDDGDDVEGGRCGEGGGSAWSGGADPEAERFLSSGAPTRRVSFNEAALFDSDKKAQEKGRRFTLTEGDFHHLKNARLTPFVRPPSMKIVTIPEWDGATDPTLPGPSAAVPLTPRPSQRDLNLPLLQPSPLPFRGAEFYLPGDATTTTSQGGGVGDCAHTVAAAAVAPVHHDALHASPLSADETADAEQSAESKCGGLVHHFLARLRRHASVEAGSPRFNIRKWRLDKSRRASSLDTRGSPRRRQFQRQRAASESTERSTHDPHHTDVIHYIAHAERLAFLQPPAPQAEAAGGTGSGTGDGTGGAADDKFATVATAAENAVTIVAVVAAASPSSSSPGPPHPAPEAASECERTSRSDGDVGAAGSDATSAPRDLWSLRASFELYASSERSSSNDRDSVRSDGESVGSAGAPGAGHLSQDFSQDEGPGCPASAAGDGKKEPRQESTESERSCGTDGEAGARKLLQMDSGYASIEAPLRCLHEENGRKQQQRTASERRWHFSSGRTDTVFESLDAEEPEAGAGAAAAAAAAAGGGGGGDAGVTSHPPERAAQAAGGLRGFLRRRDYSIDERSDALFREFLRHDPRYDETPFGKAKHRSRAHLRKQWQRSKQYSDPGVRHGMNFSASFERHRAPLRRGNSVNYPSDGRYYATLPRIVSAGDEEATDAVAAAAAAVSAAVEAKRSSPVEEPDRGCAARDRCDTGEPADTEPGDVSAGDCGSPPPGGDGGGGDGKDGVGHGYGPQMISVYGVGGDKAAPLLEERLYLALRQSKESLVQAITATDAPPDHSPV